MRTLTRGALVVASTLFAVAAYELGHADPAPLLANETVELQGWVVALDGADVVIDLGTKAGAVTGDSLELWRPIKVKHPVTGKMVTDKFLIGRVRITQVREVVSLARPEGTLLRDVAVSDVVILRKAASAPAPKLKPWAPTSGTPSAKPSATPAPPGSIVPMGPPPIDPTLTPTVADPEAEDLTRVFEELQGTPPEVRAQRYEAFVKKWPAGRFAKVLLEEATALRKGTASSKEDVATKSFARPTEVLVGTPLTFGIELAGHAIGAVLHVRGATDTTYTSLPMKPAGTGYFRVVVPAAALRPPFVSYFVEAVFPDGKSAPVEGTPTEPHRLGIVDAKAGSPATYERVFAIWTDYADYNRLRGNDYAWQTEGFFGLRFGDVGLRAARSGFGVFKGAGGSILELDKTTPAKNPRAVGLTYGYIEAEAGLSPFWGLVGRAVIGLGKDGVTGGVQGFLRIGNDKRTNMMLGGEFLGGIGLRGIAHFELAVFPKVPVALRAEVTNQPAGTSPALYDPEATTQTADVGVRFVGQVGYRFTPAFTVHVRGSYQARNIYHGGPGFGGGATIAW